jgi:hypothetical protein
MESLTLQDVFNKNWEWFVVKGRPQSAATRISGEMLRCYYRSGNSACAIGACIPDELYDPVIETWGDVYGLLGNNYSSDGYENLKTSLQQLFGDIDQITLRELQTIHDRYIPAEYNGTFRDYMMDRLTTFANLNNLEIPASI